MGRWWRAQSYPSSLLGPCVSHNCCATWKSIFIRRLRTQASTECHEKSQKRIFYQQSFATQYSVMVKQQKCSIASLKWSWTTDRSYVMAFFILLFHHSRILCNSRSSITETLPFVFRNTQWMHNVILFCGSCSNGLRKFRWKYSTKSH